MTEQTLNDTDKLLAEMNNAIRNNDVDALSKLFSEDPQLEEPKVPEQTPVQVEETPTEGGKKEEVVGEQPKQDDPNDWLSQIPEDIRANVRRLKEEHDQVIHRYKSDQGRVAAYQRKADQLQKELEQLRKHQTTKPQDNLAAALGIESDEDFQRLLEADPTFARMFERQLKKVAEKVEETYGKKFQELNSHIKQREDFDFLAKEQDKLLSAVPNAAEIVAHPAWQEFKDRSPPGVRALAESSYADDMLIAMQFYAQYVQSMSPPPPMEEPAPASTPAANPTADKVAQERARKLQGSPGVQATPPAQTAAPIDDPETLLKKYYEDIRKQNGYTK